MNGNGCLTMIFIIMGASGLVGTMIFGILLFLMPQPNIHLSCFVQGEADILFADLWLRL